VTCRIACAAILACALTGCGQSSGQAPPEAGAATITAAEARNPSFCGRCHPDQYSDWLKSMHAYAGDDPVFRAMNARGQRETDGGLGTFCINCHDPMAVRDGLTDSGLDLDRKVPPQEHGVTCIFCHSITSVTGTHNAALGLSNDLVMRGEYSDPVPNGVHDSTYSPLLDYNKADSAKACGACHDIVTPLGAHIERTFAEWEGSAFSMPGGNTCADSSCHMLQRPDVPIAQNVAVAVPKRTLHHHDFPAVDVQLGAAADSGSAASLVAGVENKLANSMVGALCVARLPTGGGIRVVLDAFNVGHDFPSGAAQDRRLWAEVNAYSGASTVPYYSSGQVDVTSSPLDSAGDPDRWVMRDCIFGADGGEVHMFWQAAGGAGGADTDDNALPALQAFVGDPRANASHVKKNFPQDGSPLSVFPDRVTLNLWLQPVGRDVLDDLVDSGDLDPSIIASMPLFPVPFGPGPDQVQLVWTADAAADSGIGSFPDSVNLQATVTCVGSLKGAAVSVPAAKHTRCAP
jgi:hypothetical protein